MTLTCQQPCRICCALSRADAPSRRRCRCRRGAPDPRPAAAMRHGVANSFERGRRFSRRYGPLALLDREWQKIVRQSDYPHDLGSFLRMTMGGHAPHREWPIRLTAELLIRRGGSQTRCETRRSASRQSVSAPRAGEIDRSNVFHRELWPELGDLGLPVGLTVVSAYGGAVSAIPGQYHRDAEEISRASGRWAGATARHRICAVNQLALNASEPPEIRQFTCRNS